MNYLLPDLFGGSPKIVHAANFPKFYIKLHRASKFHFDFRIQNSATQKRGDLFSFTLPHKTNEHAFFQNEATLVKNHNSKSARREGTILLLEGEGSVIHWDEGYFSIPGAGNYNDVIKKLYTGFENGEIALDLDGHKLKGRFILRKLHKNKWEIEKKPDAYDVLNNTLYTDNSIITGKDISYYDSLFHAQQSQLSKFSTKAEIIAFWEQNEEDCFQYKNTNLPERPYKIFPID